MQSSMVVAGMDALSESCENILTRRANQRHYSIIAQFAKRPWPCPTGSSARLRLRAKNPYPQLKLHWPVKLHWLVKLHGLATAKGRLSRCRAARACHARGLRRYRREPSSRPQQGNGTSRNRSSPDAIGRWPDVLAARNRQKTREQTGTNAHEYRREALNLRYCAHNGLVPGSSPGRPTNEISDLSILIFSTPPEIPTGSETISSKINKSPRRSSLVWECRIRVR